jgi:hypothetical protein
MVMKRYASIVCIVLVAALTLATGVIHGRMRNRWGPTADGKAAVEQLEKIPLQFGNWHCESSEKLDATSLKMLECHGYFVRKYVNSSSGEAVNVTLLLGPPGPIAVHTPEICFPSQAYKSRSPRQQVSIENAIGTADEFWALTYQASNLRADVLRVYYGWSIGGPWSAASNARYAFAGAAYLYKIQLSASVPPGVNAEKDDTGRRFLEAFLPVARPYLIEPAGN